MFHPIMIFCQLMVQEGNHHHLIHCHMHHQMHNLMIYQCFVFFLFLLPIHLCWKLHHPLTLLIFLLPLLLHMCHEIPHPLILLHLLHMSPMQSSIDPPPPHNIGIDRTYISSSGGIDVSGSGGRLGQQSYSRDIFVDVYLTRDVYVACLLILMRYFFHLFIDFDDMCISYVYSSSILCFFF